MRLRRFWLLLTSVVIGAGAVAQTVPSEEEVGAFHSLVQTAGVGSVEDALKNNPALATAEDKYGFQAIHVLDYSSFRAILSLLLRYGTDINAKNYAGHTLLHILIDSEFVPDVVEAGADLEAKDNQGRTPLLLALTEPDSYDMVRALLDAGSNPNARDNSGQGALDYARLDCEKSQTIELLIDAGASE